MSSLTITSLFTFSSPSIEECYRELAEHFAILYVNHRDTNTIPLPTVSLTNGFVIVETP